MAAREWLVAAGEANLRLDHFLADRAGCSRGEAVRLIDAGAVRVDGRRGKKGARLAAGARVSLSQPPAVDEARRPVPDPDVPLDVRYVDDALVAVSKPAGIASHPLRPGERGTLANALVARHPECAAVADDPREGGLVHRLDTDTSGILLAARTRDAWLALRHAFATRQVEKRYLALVAGHAPPRGEVSVPLVQAGPRVRADAADVGAQPAHTEFRRLADRGEVSLVAAVSRTGRRHQIRAHLAWLGHPIVGDPLYGGPPAPPGAPGHFLHAAALALPHPTGGTPLSLRAPLPPERARVLRELFDWEEDRA